MGEGGGGRRERKGFSPSALSLFRFHLSPFPPETPDTQARRGEEEGGEERSEKGSQSEGRETPETDIFTDAFHPRTVWFVISQSTSFVVLRSCCYQHEKLSVLSISPSLGVRGKEVLERGWGGGEGREREAWPKTFVSFFPPPLKSLLPHGPCFTDSSHEGFSLAVSLLLKYNVLKSLDQNLAPKSPMPNFRRQKPWNQVTISVTIYIKSLAIDRDNKKMNWSVGLPLDTLQTFDMID